MRASLGGSDSVVGEAAARMSQNSYEPGTKKKKNVWYLLINKVGGP